MISAKRLFRQPASNSVSMAIEKQRWMIFRNAWVFLVHPCIRILIIRMKSFAMCLSLSMSEPLAGRKSTCWVEAVELKASGHWRTVLATRCWRDTAHFKKQWLNLIMVMNCSTNTVVFVVISCMTRMRVFRRYWHQR